MVVGAGYPAAPRLHELEDGHLSSYVLEGDPVRAEEEIALPGL